MSEDMDYESDVLTAAQVDEWVNTVLTVKGDNEVAHGREDEILVAVLRAIADGRVEDAAEVASAALTTQEIEYDRWYA